VRAGALSLCVKFERRGLVLDPGARRHLAGAANADPSRYERAALRWLQRFIDERSPPLTEVSLAASALAELRHGKRNVGIETLRRLLRRGGLAAWGKVASDFRRGTFFSDDLVAFV